MAMWWTWILTPPPVSILKVSQAPLLPKREEEGLTPPIVDDEVRRSARLRNVNAQKHIQLDGEPRRRKGATKKSVSFSSVADLKKAIVSCSLDDALVDFEVAPIQASTLAELGSSFCGIPPAEVSPATLLLEDEDQ
jgi:hypothetical protein